MKRTSASVVLIALTLVAISGCVRESSEGSTRGFSYDLWIPLSVLLGGVIAGPAGWLLRKNSGRVGWSLLIVGPLAALFLGPSLLLERSTVDESGLSVRSGIWGMTAVHEVKFDNLQSVRITEEESRGRRGRKTINHYLVCQNKDGSSAKVGMNNDVTRAGGRHFLDKAAERGIPVMNETSQ